MKLGTKFFFFFISKFYTCFRLVGLQRTPILRSRKKDMSGQKSGLKGIPNRIIHIAILASKN